MRTARILPSRLEGSVRAPPSKSYTHRAAIAAFLSGKRSRIDRPLLSDDTRATVRGLRALGARVTVHRERWFIRAAGPPSGVVRIDAGASGTSLRFLVPVAASSNRPVEFTGSPRLARRPIRPLLRALADNGAKVRLPRGKAAFPLRIRGPIHPGVFRVPGDETSQFLSGLLLTLPRLERDSVVRLDGPLVSASYVDSTVAVLARHNLHVRHRGTRWRVPAPQRYSGAALTVPGDASSAAYLWAGAAVTGGRVITRNLDPGWPQADFQFLSVLSRMGVSVERSGDGIRVEGRARKPFSADLRGAPDLVPLAAMLGAMVPDGPTRLRFSPALRRKESDRVRETEGLVRALGARVTSGIDTMAISPGDPPSSLRWNPPEDHRLVMASAVAALGLAQPSRLAGADRVSKSFPGFWAALAELGAEVTG